MDDCEKIGHELRTGQKEMKVIENQLGISGNRRKDHAVSGKAGVGNLFSSKGHFNMYNIIYGPHKII